ncbi:MAG: pilus assembly protein TadG-related protein [Eubacteriales bacterium]|nr:pilus assembly protein TadG-related protein [Eubacteriales bacterium]
MKQRLQRQFRRFRIQERGESLLIVAFAITALVGVTATVTDLGAAYVKTAQTQTAVDAAAMAAGMKLPIESGDATKLSQATATAREYLAKNGVDDPSAASVTFGNLEGGAYHSVDVAQPAESETAFARIFGINEITFTREAEARVVPCAALSDLVPLSIQRSILNEMIAGGTTQHAILKYGSNTDEVENGSFGAIDLDGVKGGGANDYTSWLAYGYQAKLTVGTVLPVESGNMTGPTYSGIVQRYNACTHYPSSGGCKAGCYADDCPRVMKLPVIEYTDSSNKYVRVVGFAAFVLEDYTTYVDQGCVIGSYVDMVNIGAADGDLSGTADGFGVYSLVLSK